MTSHSQITRFNWKCIWRLTTRLRVWAIEEYWFDSREKLEMFFFSESSLPLRRTRPRMLWVTEGLFLGVRRPRREADHLPPSDAKNQHSFCLHFSLCHHNEHRNNFFLNPLERWPDPEYEGTKSLRNVDDCLPVDKPLCTGRLKIFN